MRTCCIYAVGMSLAVKQPPAADRVYAHVKQAVLDRHYEGGTLLTEGELAERVIPVRLRWIGEHVDALQRLLADLDARWTASGRMADASLRPDEK